MKGLLTLIKLHQRNLDALRREMTGLETQKAQLQEQSRKIDEELRMEIQLAGNTPEMSHFFGDFARRIKKRQEQIAHEITLLDQKIAKLNENITEAFAELKKFEIARDNAKQRLLDEQNRKDNIMMDEIAARQHQQKQES